MINTMFAWRYVVWCTFLISCYVDLVSAGCGRPTIPPLGSLFFQGPTTHSDFSNGYVVRVVCDDPDRMTPEGDGFMTCTNDGWTPSYACRSFCNAPPPILHGMINMRQNDMIASYRCSDAGYRLSEEEGTRKRKCQENGSWSGTAPRCRPMPICEEPVLPDHVVLRRLNGRRRDGLWTFGSKVDFSCEEGYLLNVANDQDTAIECIRSGWNTTAPTCVYGKCPPLLDVIVHGQSSVENRTYDPHEEIHFQCDAGYRTTSQSWRVCNLVTGYTSGLHVQWGGVTPICEVTRCAMPAILQNGERIVDQQSVNVGVNASFRCNGNFELIGDSFLTCLETGQWNGSVPVCDNGETDCPVLGPPLNGRKIGDRYDAHYTVDFECNSGYALSGSSQRRCLQDGQWDGEEARCIGHQDFDDINRISAVFGESINRLQVNALFDNVIVDDGQDPGNNRSRFIPVTHKVGVDLYFMFDASASVGEENFKKAKKFAKDLVREIGVTDKDNSLRVGALVFSSEAIPSFHTVDFDTTDGVVHAIEKNVPYIGEGTNIAKAFEVVRDVLLPQTRILNRPESFKTIFLITDGAATDGGTPDSVVNDLKRDGVKIHCMGISENASRPELTKIASTPHKEFLFFLKEYHEIPAMIKAVTDQPQDYSECGISAFTVPKTHTVGKVEAKTGAWPWQIYLKIATAGGNYAICGGTLIRSDWILTAAHCFPNNNIFEAYAGVTDSHRKPAHSQLFTPNRPIIHSDYEPDTQINDIALIKVEPPAQLTPNVRPACLPDPTKADRLLHKRSAIMTGWGYKGIVSRNEWNNEENRANLLPEANLQQLAMPLKTREECAESLEGDHEAGWWDDSMTCAGYLNTEVGPCRGDSGGPLIKNSLVNGTRRWTIIGVNSWGRGCAQLNELDFFSNVPFFMPWINEKINPPEEAEAASAEDEEEEEEVPEDGK